MDFKDKVAVITGGASGIGRSVALALARLGTDIVIADIDDTGLKEVSREIENIGRHVIPVHCDTSKDLDMDNLVFQTISRMGKVDILMNNAGVALRGFIDKLSIAEWNWILDINLLGPVRGVRAFLPHMLKRGIGYIINTASAAGLMASGPANVVEKNIAYSTSKFGLVGFSEGLYAYLRPKGIMVSVLCPGWVSTKLSAHTHYVGDSQKEADDMKLEWENLIESPEAKKPDAIAQILIEAINEERFLVITDPEIYEILKDRGQNVHKLENYLKDNCQRTAG